MRNLLFLSILLNITTTYARWNPVPPCTIPPGISDPAEYESMCTKELYKEPNDVIIREFGLPLNETLVTVSYGAPQWPVIAAYGITQILDYFSGENNEEKKNILDARTSPYTLRPSDNYTNWIAGLMVSTSEFYDNTTLPTPIDPVILENVGFRYLAVFQFNTSIFPALMEFQNCESNLTSRSLPTGFSINYNSSWTPTYAIYNGETAKKYTNECWVEVNKNKV